MAVLKASSKKALLDLARHSIRTYLKEGNYLSFVTEDPELTASLGCFVTLYQKGNLRGCIGTFDRSEALYENVIRMAVAAATQDPRFQSVGSDELDALTIEISVLGALEPMQDMMDFELGKHGVMVKSGARSGTFLPDVAIQQGWSKEQFVMTCAKEKARLSPEECVQAELYRYEVDKCQSPS